MSLTILGSAAAEGVPALFCDCETCREARRRGGKDIRRRTAYRWHQDVLIDLGPDLFSQQIAFGLDLSRLRHVLFTHSHMDHFHPESLFFRHPGFSVVPQGSWVTLYGNRKVGYLLHQRLPVALEECSVDFRLVRAGQEIDLGRGRSVLPLPAAHDRGEECLNFLLRSPHGTIMLGNDTGWWPQETWEWLAEEQLDVVVLDCTYGLGKNYGGHMGVEQVVAARQELLRLGVLHPGSRVIANHFSHNGGCLHADLQAALQPEGMEVGYDGMVVGATTREEPA